MAAAGERRASALQLRRALPGHTEPATHTAPVGEALGVLSVTSGPRHATKQLP